MADPPLPDTPFTRADVLTGTQWAAVGAVGRYLIAGITTYILTQLLDPADFGLIAVAILAQLVIEYILPVGFHDVLIQHPALSPSLLDGAFWSTLLLGLTAFAIVCLLAAPVATWFDQPALASLLIVISAAALLRTVSTVPRALLSRRLDFRALTLARLGAMLIASLGAMLIAASGAGAWSLVAQVALLNGTGSIIVFRITRWRPTRIISRAALRSLWQFAPSVAAVAALSTFITRIDDQIVGYRLGVEALGYYTLAYAFLAWPVFDVLGRVSVVLYPVFARLQDDLPTLRAVYLDWLRLITLVSFPLLALGAITAPVLIPWLLGSTWKPIVIPAQLFMLGGLRSATNALNGSIYRALGKPHLHTLLELASVPCYLIAFWIGVQHGIAGVALLTALTGLLLQPLGWWLLFSITEMTLFRWIRTILPATVGTVLLASTAIPLLHLTASWDQALLRLLVVGTAGAVVYALWLFVARILTSAC